MKIKNKLLNAHQEVELNPFSLVTLMRTGLTLMGTGLTNVDWADSNVDWADSNADWAVSNVGFWSSVRRMCSYCCFCSSVQL